MAGNRQVRFANSAEATLAVCNERGVPSVGGALLREFRIEISQSRGLRSRAKNIFEKESERSMLIKAIYLDAEALAHYSAGLEGGLRSGASTINQGGGGLGGRLNFGPVAVDGKRENSSSTTIQVEDHDTARLARLLDAAKKEAEHLLWREVIQPDVDLADLPTGAMIQWDCDIYIPDIIKQMQPKGGVGDAIELLEGLLPMATSLGLNTDGLPATEQMSAVSQFVKGASIPPVVVGESHDGESRWKIAGTLKPDCLTSLDDLDGPAICVGKVIRIVRSDKWHPLLTFPGMNLMGREERRKLERKSPEPGHEDNYLQGPAVLLDVLAIYR